MNNFGNHDIIVSELYPNPASGQINIDLISLSGTPIDITITDITGRPVLNKSIRVAEGSNSLALDISGLAHGLYNISLHNERQPVSFLKFIKK